LQDYGLINHFSAYRGNPRLSPIEGAENFFGPGNFFGRRRQRTVNRLDLTGMDEHLASETRPPHPASFVEQTSLIIEIGEHAIDCVQSLALRGQRDHRLRKRNL